MNKRKQYYPKRNKAGGKHLKQGGTRVKSRILKMKPNIDPALKKVFSTIGVPEKKEFKPDQFQTDALKAIEIGDCLVTAPTGTGKTWIAEKAIARIFKKGGRSWYASPLKALTNSKYKEFSEIFGPENLGILTGDRKENLDAPVITGTTEILRNQLYDAMHQGTTLPTDLVILDEAHFLGDPDRGVVWEEIMIYLPVRIPLLLLSATIGNARGISRWLKSIRFKECTVIEEKKRPVPLFPLFLHPSGKLFPLMSDTGKKGSRHEKVNAFLNSKHPPVIAPFGKLPPFGDIIQVLRKYHLLPAIFFLKSRADCDNALNLCTELLSDAKKTELGQKIDMLVPQHAHIAMHKQLSHLKNKGIGAHHSGQLPAWKIVLETLMTEGLLETIFATSTVAAGVNFPARSIVLLNSDRFNGSNFLPLSSTEFHQMAGRAGRRGMDNIGFAVVLPGRFMDIKHTARLVNLSSSDVISQIKIDFSMVLNLLLSHTPDKIELLLKKSFAAFLIKKSKKKSFGKKLAKYGENFLKHDFIKHLNFLKENKYVHDNGTLTEDGIWASRLRVDQPLMIAEGFRLKAFPESDPPLLAAIIAGFVNEYENDENINTDLLSPELVACFMKIKSDLIPFAELMVEKKFDVRQLFFRPVVTIYNWALGRSWEEVLAISEMAEGNLAMLILRTADNLRHIRALFATFPEASQSAAKAIELIMREPVIMDY